MIQASDDIAIRNLVATYADAIGSGDLDAWQATWSPDGVWEIAGQVVKGTVDIGRFMSDALERFPKLLQVVFSGIVREGKDGIISGIWHVLEVQQAGEADERLLVGRYEDTYAKLDGRWVFAERRFSPLYRGPMTPGMLAR